MPDGLIYLLVFIAIVVIYTIAKVIDYMRQSERQWEQVDKSKLKEWDDEDDEDGWLDFDEDSEDGVEVEV